MWRKHQLAKLQTDILMLYHVNLLELIKTEYSETITMTFLYRGVSKQLDLDRKGLLTPLGSYSEVAARYDGKMRYDGTFVYGVSRSNAVRAHHIESGLYDGCFVSTTRNREKAIYFATTGYTESGWIYVIDPDLFNKYEVESEKFSDPKYPTEEEISICAKDCQHIPKDVIIEKYEVDENGKRKF